MADMPPLDSEAWKRLLEWLGVLWLLGLLGRMTWHIQQVKAGRRRFWSLALLWEVPLAAFCGIAGGGLGSYLGLVGVQLLAFASVIAYLGPGGIEALAEKVVDYYTHKPSGGNRDE